MASWGGPGIALLAAIPPYFSVSAEEELLPKGDAGSLGGVSPASLLCTDGTVNTFLQHSHASAHVPTSIPHLLPKLG